MAAAATAALAMAVLINQLFDFQMFSGLIIN